MKKQKKRLKRLFDLENATATLIFPDGREVVMPFNGLAPDTILHLAMIGAMTVVLKRADPVKAWKLVEQGILGRDTRNRKIPLAVRALASLMETDDTAALKLWRSMSKAERKKVKGDAAIRALMSHMTAQELAVAADEDSIKNFLKSLTK